MDFRFLRDDVVNLARYLPDFLSEDPTFKNTLTVLGTEHEKLRQQIMDLAAQAFVTTATWGLADWERILGLTGRPGATIEDRRNRILLYLQSSQTVTKEFMTRLVRRYCEEPDSTDIEIVEDNERYAFQIRTTGGWFINMDDLHEAIELYKPAHLGYTLVPVLLMRDTFAMSSLHQLMLELTGFMERYPWRGRYANGAYQAGPWNGWALCNGAYYADGILLANGATSGCDANYYGPYLADGTYAADGALLARCWHETAVIYADSAEVDSLTDGVAPCLSEAVRVALLADGRFLADGGYIAGNENDIADAFGQQTSCMAADSAVSSEHASAALTADATDESRFVRMFYADGAFHAGAPITANGSYSAGGAVQADGFGGLISQSAHPQLADGLYKADGGILPGTRAINARADSDENRSDRVELDTGLSYSEDSPAAEHTDAELRALLSDRIDIGTVADGAELADGHLLAGAEMLDDSMALSNVLQVGDNEGQTYANGSYIADGRLTAAGMSDELTIIIGLGTLADGRYNADAAGALRADGGYKAAGNAVAAQIYAAHFYANGSILANGTHITGTGGATCDYKYYAA